MRRRTSSRQFPTAPPGDGRPPGGCDPRRTRRLNDAADAPGPVLYWMSRDQRVRDNWALLHAQALALERRAPLAVVFALCPAFLGAAQRQYGFMLAGLREVERALRRLGIPLFAAAAGPEGPGRTVAALTRRLGAGAIVTDFDPLRIKRQWKRELLADAAIPVIEVDAHNVVPCWLASPKQEFGAYTLRPKLRRLLPEFATDIPQASEHPVRWKGRVTAVDWHGLAQSLRVDANVGEATGVVPGEKAAAARLHAFATTGLVRYAGERNDPLAKAQSGLSPYLHFGQLAPQRVAWEVLRADALESAREAFLEELVVRRELADNFCHYCPRYDSVEGFPAWARKTLDAHRGDARPLRYTPAQLEAGATHDDLWNAAQREMAGRGTLHGYLRMYWAKKILEWTASPEEAMEVCIRLNDRYQLDGRDPNGYAGIAWSVGGVHDRAWGERPIFGKIRYMSYNGCRGKFDVKAYVRATL